MITVTLHNKAGQPLSAIEIGFTGKVLWQGALETGESTWTFGIPNQDGSVEVPYLVGDQRHDAACGYVTSGLWRNSFAIEILPDGQFKCEQN